MILSKRLRQPLQKPSQNNGFTIVELLVVIVVIAILAAISIVSYVGITQKAAISTLKFDLKNASTQLEIDKTINGNYPNTAEEANNGKGLQKSVGTDFQYSIVGGNYYLNATSLDIGNIAFYVSSETGGVITSGTWTAPVVITEITFAAQELYVPYPADHAFANTLDCKEWSDTGGQTVKSFLVSHATEGGYDWFSVYADNIQVYNASGAVTDVSIDISSSPATVLKACLSTDLTVSGGYGGQVTKVFF